MQLVDVVKENFITVRHDYKRIPQSSDVLVAFLTKILIEILKEIRSHLMYLALSNQNPKELYS